ncbi:Serine carboxypeptidase-like 45 [Camellia lanceoleosa]|uniref:Serine carboxypeptidase-like 45 n=1 Tax=Camellia lanceoleosa TaxID=1840588 RepID=A0ACC0FXU0_9ERIC|nr:Serine carboxypeptidase-like 45 [Camellia lanceoleosa]
MVMLCRRRESKHTRGPFQMERSSKYSSLIQMEEQIMYPTSLENERFMVALANCRRKVSYQQFSGHVTVDAKKQKALVLEAESNPTSKPLVICLN